MNIEINGNYLNVKQNYLFSEVGARVNLFSQQHPDKKIVRLGIGDVTRPLAPIVIDAMHKAVDEMAHAETFKGYPPDYGYDFLLTAVKNHYADFGVALSTDEIYISDGAKSDVGNIVDILGDNHILIPDPVYPVYMDSNIMSGRKISLISSGKENGFLPTPDELDGSAYVIYLCSPNNPTGAVYDKAGLQKWVDYANRSGSLIIFDSAYEAFISADEPHSVFCIEGARNCSIEICSLSKTAGFTGTRCAWTVIPNELTAKDGTPLCKLWRRRQSTKFNGLCYVVQRGAEAALSPEGIRQCRELIDYYRVNAQNIAALMKRKGIFFTGGISSPYIWLECPDHMGSWEFFDLLLNRVQVVGTPGEGFGKCGEGYFRLTSFGTHENTDEAIRRLETIL